MILYNPLVIPSLLFGLLYFLQGSNAERISAIKCREYKEFYRETFETKAGREPIKGKLKCPRFRRVYQPELKRDVFQHEFPHTASLWYEADVNSTTSGFKFRCSGTLISRRHVLVPGHCIYSKWGKPTHVMFGDTNLYKEMPDARRQVVQISEIILHPNYVPPSFVDDIALVVLKKGVKYDVKSRSPRPSVRPACLPIERQPITHGVGLTAFDTNDGTLRTERVQLFKSIHDCEPVLKEQQGSNFTVRFGEKLRGTVMCSHGVASGTCVNDLGGTLVIQAERSFQCIDTVIGVLSVNSATCEPGAFHPIVYTKVEQYLDWIENVIWPSQPKPADLLPRSGPEKPTNITVIIEAPQK